jgi:HEAT repeat protein
MQTRILAILTACSLLFVVAISLAAETAADLPKLIAEAASYQSGQSAEPLWKIEEMLRQSADKPALRADLEAGLVKLLVPSATFEARRFACQWLMAIGTDASLPALAELLKSEETVGIACLALSSRCSPKANEVLRNALAFARGRTRLQIIGALGDHRDAEAVKTLSQLARDADTAVAETAILALAKIGSPPARDAIASLHKEARPAQALAVIEANQRVAQQLAAAGDRKAALGMYAGLLGPEMPVNVRRGALLALMELDPDGGQQRILDTLSGRDRALVPVAVARVGTLKSDGASKTFAAMLPRLAPSERTWMIEALASRGDASAREAIRAQVSDADAGVRRVAVSAVGKLEDASAVPLLTKALSEARSAEELHDAELALIGLRGSDATDKAIVAALSQSSTATKVRLFSVLARRGARVAVPALLVEAEGADAATVRAAFRALGKLTAAGDLPALLERLADLKAADARADAESAAARAMAKVLDVAQRSQAVRSKLTNTSDLEARCSLLRLLPGAADAGSLSALESASRDKDARIRDAAVRALAAWPETSGWETLLAIVRQPENSAHRTIAMRGLVRLAGELNAKPDAALIGRYRQLLAAARGDDDRKLVLSALAGAAHPDALGLALPLLSNAGVRAETELAVKKIAAAVQASHPQAAQAALERLNKSPRSTSR